MASTPDNPQQQTPTQPQGTSQPPLDTLLGSSEIVRIGQVLSTFIGVMITVFSYFQQHPIIVVIGIAILLLTVVWHFLARWWQRRQRRPVPIPPPPGPRAYLRGLLPFERGETLLGRDGDVQRVLALVASTEFRFGYLSGEAGCGKTSLLRAGVVPQAESQGWVVVYVPRTSDNPRTTLLQALEKQFPNAAGEGEGRSLRATLTATVRSQKIPRLLVVFDQFEEFLIANPTRADRIPFLTDIGECYAAAGLPIAFLFSLRKEFVEDLQDFTPGVPQPLDSRFRGSLRNWDRDTALRVLNAAAAHDQVGFADTLKEQLVADLLRDGQVRPVELQVVATRLQDEGIYDVPRYRAAGGARGILAAYVKEAIEPLGPGTPELTRQITRHLLRALCAENRDVRRPKGLQLAELRDQIRAAMQASGQGGLLASDAALDVALRDALQRCLQRYLVIPESEESYNLAHDYIVPSIQDATADLRTVEDQANQLLKQYLDYQSGDPHVVIPWRHWRFIGKHASSELKSREAASRLFRRTRRRLAGLAALAGLVLTLILTLILPPGTDLVIRTMDVDSPDWVVARDRRLAVALTRSSTANVKAKVWRMDQPWRLEGLAIPFMDIISSPHSTFLAGRTHEGNVYVWRSQDQLTRETRPVVTGLPQSRPWPPWAGFSDDEKWVFVASGDGRVYVWNPAEPPAENPRPFLSLKSRQRGDWWEAPRVGFSPPGSQWLAAVDADSGLYLYQPADGPPEQPRPVLSGGYDNRDFTFSSDGQWLAMATHKGVYAWPTRMRALDALPPVKSAEGRESFKLSFSPDGKWLFIKATFENFYAWKVTDPPNGPVKALTDLPRGGTNRGFAPIRFSRDGKWAGGVAYDGGVYVWSLDTVPDRPSSAIIPAEEKGGQWANVRFSPKGDFVVGRGSGGAVYAWKLGEPPDLSKPIAHYDATCPVVDFSFTADGRLLFAWGGNTLDWGELGQPLQPILRTTYDLEAIAMTPQGEELIVFGTRHLITVRWKFSFWGIPLLTRPWPRLEEREEEE
jgi:WD40 repeat protein